MVKENTIPAVEKTVRLLNQLSVAAGAVSQTELAKQNQISGATCYRILQSLLKYGWIKKAAGGYVLATGLLPLARRVCQAEEWQELIREPLMELAARTRLAVKLSVRRGAGEYMTAFRAESPEPMAVTGKVGATFPVVEGTVGGALLYRAEDAELLRLLDAMPGDVPEKLEPEQLFTRIAECREKGYCCSRGKNRWGIEAVSAPLTGPAGEVLAAISLIGLSHHFKDPDALGVILLQTVKQCALRIGG